METGAKMAARAAAATSDEVTVVPSAVTFRLENAGCEMSRQWLTALGPIVQDLLDAREGRIALLQEALRTSDNLIREYQALHREAARVCEETRQELDSMKGQAAASALGGQR
ncbi:hypothetical protein L226DRAFT_575054 [Lentinus tigrinus ALCF2SS1-7]|nr:hypothetical protein L226DRAFT_575054 [Lentinus tigrinus ALCF2SS1-7]